LLNSNNLHFKKTIFAAMKKKFLILNYLMPVVLLFSIVFQAVHSYEHIEEQFSEKKCLHRQVSNHELTHQHQTFEHCFVCDFALNNFVTQDFLYFNFENIAVTSQSPFSNSKEITLFFRGSLFALRAPPSFIV
jgi:hypothetical protein